MVTQVTRMFGKFDAYHGPSSGFHSFFEAGRRAGAVVAAAGFRRLDGSHSGARRRGLHLPFIPRGLRRARPARQAAGLEQLLDRNIADRYPALHAALN